MGRGRTPHGLVPNARARRIAYEKRKNGLMKKAREFSVLCGVDTCVVVFPEAAAGVDRPIAPEVWPPDHGEARRIIERYRSASRDALADRKKKKKKKEKLDLGGAGEGELLGELSERQLRSLLSILGDGVDLAKRKLAAVKEEKRVAMAGAILGPCNEEGPSVDAVPQKTPHQRARPVRRNGSPVLSPTTLTARTAPSTAAGKPSQWRRTILLSSVLF
ncbi:MADS-box transcription factor 4 [Eucalyptus grandis]|uniref:MADS-box transcription factor 4 n=1 Tax=Eucalyptus grandis TaxID=71139 RepID=UPI00192EEAAC|nr:MADS-box transcription factor 4 [Eucalyptus grandis]